MGDEWSHAAVHASPASHAHAPARLHTHLSLWKVLRSAPPYRAPSRTHAKPLTARTRTTCASSPRAHRRCRTHTHVNATRAALCARTRAPSRTHLFCTAQRLRSRPINILCTCACLHTCHRPRTSFRTRVVRQRISPAPHLCVFHYNSHAGRAAMSSLPITHARALQHSTPRATARTAHCAHPPLQARAPHVTAAPAERRRDDRQAVSRVGRGVWRWRSDVKQRHLANWRGARMKLKTPRRAISGVMA